MTLLVECGREHLSEREYAVGVLLRDFLGLEHRVSAGGSDGVVIRLSEDDGRRLRVADALLGRPGSLVSPDRLPEPPLRTVAAGSLPGARLLGDLPVLYGDGTNESAYDGEHDILELGVDVFGGAFALLTRLEEAVPGPRDEHGRFPASAALASPAGFVGRPLVNEYAEVLWWGLSRLWPRLQRRRRSFRILPTHDVDWPYLSRGRIGETVGAAAADLAVRHNRGLALERLRTAWRVRRHGQSSDPYNSFEFLLRTSEEQGVRSAFYFMAGASDRRFDPGARLGDSWLRSLLREIARRGHEIGLHPSYRAAGDERRLRAEADALRGACDREGIDRSELGGRQHFLRWTNPASWRAWSNAGLAYDSTVGWAETGGFRAGSCYEFPVFDLEQRVALPLVERPLIAMEASYLAYQDRTPREAADAMRALKERCRVFDGDFTFLWHNNRLTTPEEREAYDAVVRG